VTPQVDKGGSAAYADYDSALKIKMARAVPHFNKKRHVKRSLDRLRSGVLDGEAWVLDWRRWGEKARQTGIGEGFEGKWRTIGVNQQVGLD